MKKKVYTHLTYDERLAIEKGIGKRQSFSMIARDLGKERSTVSREVRRNRTQRKGELPPKHPRRRRHAQCPRHAAYSSGLPAMAARRHATPHAYTTSWLDAHSLRSRRMSATGATREAYAANQCPNLKMRDFSIKKTKANSLHYNKLALV